MLKNNHPLKTVCLKVLEDWGMMIVDEVTEPSAEMFCDSEQVYISSVNLHGVITGSVSILSQLPFMQTLARNVLGIDDLSELTKGDCLDAFKEMGNILAGNFITEAYGEDVVFDLLNPSVSETSFSSVTDFIDKNIVFAFLADDAPVAVSFNIKHT